MHYNATQGEHDLILQLDKAGFSAAQIAARVGVNPRTINRWRAKNGRAQGNPQTPRPTEQRELARRLLEDGASLKEVARTIGTKHPIVRRWFPDAAGWTQRDGGIHRATTRKVEQAWK